MRRILIRSPHPAWILILDEDKNIGSFDDRYFECFCETLWTQVSTIGWLVTDLNLAANIDNVWLLRVCVSRIWLKLTHHHPWLRWSWFSCCPQEHELWTVCWCRESWSGSVDQDWVLQWFYQELHQWQGPGHHDPGRAAAPWTEVCSPSTWLKRADSRGGWSTSTLLTSLYLL